MRRGLFQTLLVALAAVLFSITPLWADDIAIGVSTPMTGPAAGFGRGVVDGARLAIDAINAHGGISGKKVQLIAYDDQCDPAHAVAETQRMIVQDKVSALIGYPCNLTAVAAARVATESDVLLIATNEAPSPSGTINGPVLHMLDRSGRLSTTVADYIKNKFPDKKIGLWFPTASGLATTIQRSIENHNIRPETDFNFSPPPSLSSIDILVVSSALMPSLEPTLGANPKLEVIVPAPVLSDQLTAAVQSSTKIVALTNPTPQFFPDATAALAQAREAHVPTTGYFVYAYAAVQVFAEAEQRAQSLSGTALFKAATQSAIKTILGSRSFDENGSIRNLLIVATQKSGETVASVDFCKRDDCRQWEQCPPDCPK